MRLKNESSSARPQHPHLPLPASSSASSCFDDAVDSSQLATDSQLLDALDQYTAAASSSSVIVPPAMYNAQQYHAQVQQEQQQQQHYHNDEPVADSNLAAGAPLSSDDDDEEEDDADDDALEADQLAGVAASDSQMQQQLASLSVERELIQLTQQAQQALHRIADEVGTNVDDEEGDGEEEEDEEEYEDEDESMEGEEGQQHGDEPIEEQEEPENIDDWLFAPLQPDPPLDGAPSETREMYDPTEFDLLRAPPIDMITNGAAAAASSSSYHAAASSHDSIVSPQPAWFHGDTACSANFISHYVPSYLSAAYASEFGITELYAWQAECIKQDQARPMIQHGNIVYSAPTSGGKTLVAEILLFRYMLKYNLYRSHCSEFQSSSGAAASSSSLVIPAVFRSLFIVPFNSLVQEKARDLQVIIKAMYQHLQHTPSSTHLRNLTTSTLPLNQPFISPDIDAPKIHVKAIESVGDFSADSHILIGVVTIEKAAMIINAMITEKRTAEIGCVVIDECHMLGDESRGFLLEHVLTKLRLADFHRQQSATASMPSNTHYAHLQHYSQPTLPPLQIIAMSATLPNIDHLCRCLNASFYATLHRPVELSEKYATQSQLGDNKIALFLHDGRQDGVKKARYHPIIFPILRSEGKEYYDPTLLGYLCYETVVTQQRNAIVFCSSKAACVRHAKKIAAVLKHLAMTDTTAPSNNTVTNAARTAELMVKRKQLLEQMQSVTLVLDPTLKLTIPHGVAFHHAGLTFPERDLIEAGYRVGILSILCATTTLACGVNLGAARVIFTSLKTGREQMDAATYKQCVSPDTLLAKYEGEGKPVSPIRADQMTQDDILVTYDEWSGMICPITVSSVTRGSETKLVQQRMYTLTTSLGQTLTCTANHELQLTSVFLTHFRLLIITSDEGEEGTKQRKKKFILRYVWLNTEVQLMHVEVELLCDDINELSTSLQVINIDLSDPPSAALLATSSLADSREMKPSSALPFQTARSHLLLQANFLKRSKQTAPIWQYGVTQFVQMEMFVRRWEELSEKQHVTGQLLLKQLQCITVDWDIALKQLSPSSAPPSISIPCPIVSIIPESSSTDYVSITLSASHSRATFLLSNGLSTHNCSGRAGRKGKDDQGGGESIIIAADDYFGNRVNWIKHEQQCQRIIRQEMAPLNSCLDQQAESIVVQTIQNQYQQQHQFVTETIDYYPYLCRLILDAVCAELVCSREEIDFLCTHTLLYQQKPASNVQRTTKISIDWLMAHSFLEQYSNTERYFSNLPPYGCPSFLLRATPLGRATTVSTLSPNDALIVYQHLSSARNQLILDGGLHVLFLITPLKVNFELDFRVYSELLSQLSPAHASVAEHLGVQSPQISAWEHNPPSSARRASLSYQIYVRFYATLILLEFMLYENRRWEEGEGDRRQKRTFQIESEKRGMYQQLYESTKAYGTMISNFCLQLQWIDLAWTLKNYTGEQMMQCETLVLTGGAQAHHHQSSSILATSVVLTSLRPLMELKNVRPSILAALYKAGLTTVRQVRESTVEEICAILRKCRVSVLMQQEDVEDTAEYQAERLKRKADRVMLLQSATEEKQRVQLLQARHQRLGQLGHRHQPQERVSAVNVNPAVLKTSGQKRQKLTETQHQVTTPVHISPVAPHVAAAATSSSIVPMIPQQTTPRPTRQSLLTTVAPPTTSPASAMPPSTALSQYPTSMLMDQLRTPNLVRHRPMTTPTTQTAQLTAQKSKSPPVMVQSRLTMGMMASATAVASSSSSHATTAATTKSTSTSTSTSSLTCNLSLLSHAEWLVFKEAWSSTRSHMYWQFFGLRRTRQEEKRRKRVMRAVEGGENADMMEDDAAAIEEKDEGAIELTPAEQDDLILSPHCRTFFLPSHASQYPLSLQSIEGIALSFDADPTVYELRVGDQFNKYNELGADGEEMWETFCSALLNPKLTCISINMKSNFEILSCLPMPRTLIQRIYAQAAQRMQQQQQQGHSAAASSVSLTSPLSTIPSSSRGTTFLTLFHLISTTSRPLNLVDIRVAHWLLMPTDKNLLRLESYTEWYVQKRAAKEAIGGNTAATGNFLAAMAAQKNKPNAAAAATSANKTLTPAAMASVSAIPCSPDKSAKSGYVQQDHLHSMRSSIMQRSQYAPRHSAATMLAPQSDSRWNQVSQDRYRYPVDFASACTQVQQLPPLYTTLLRQLVNSELIRSYREIELPLLPVLAHIEYYGMGFNRTMLLYHLDRMYERYQYLDYSARSYVNTEIDLQSPIKYIPLMQSVLEAHGVSMPSWFLQAQRAKKRGPIKDVPQLLKELSGKHPLPAIIQEYRLLALTLAHLTPVPAKAVPHSDLKHDRIHPTLLNVTETGRLSCQEPNIQSMPKQSGYFTAPRYSIHEELLRSRISCVPSSTGVAAQIHVHLSDNEKRVEREQREARANEMHAIQQKRTTPASAQKLKQLRDANVDRRLHCMVIQPSGETQYGIVRDIRIECINRPGVTMQSVQNTANSSSSASSAAAAAAATAAVALQSLPLADWWHRKSQGRLQWSPEAASVVRQVLVQLQPDVTLPYPADLVWRHEAWVPWSDATQVKSEPKLQRQDASSSSAMMIDVKPQISIPTVTSSFPLPCSRPLSIPFSMRNCFEASPGYTLLSADYSNIELRLMAHFSRDKNLIEMFKANVDVLTSMASRLNDHIPLESVTPAQRAIAKSCVYAVLYGAGIDKVAQDSGLSLSDATHFFNSFKTLFRGVVEFTQKQVLEVAKTGFVTTLFQRKRWLRVNDSNPHVRAGEQRKVPNTLCQGSAADLIKAAMHRIMQSITSESSQVKYHESARMIMQMHDELLFEVRNDRLAQMKSLIQSRMEFQDAEFQLRVPLVVRIKVGKRWGSMTQWKEEKNEVQMV